MKAAVQALRENPSWARMPRAWVRVACWAFFYTEDVPGRNEIAKALVASSYGPRGPERKERYDD